MIEVMQKLLKTEKHRESVASERLQAAKGRIVAIDNGEAWRNLGAGVLVPGGVYMVRAHVELVSGRRKVRRFHKHGIHPYIGFATWRNGWKDVELFNEVTGEQVVVDDVEMDHDVVEVWF